MTKEQDPDPDPDLYQNVTDPEHWSGYSDSGRRGNGGGEACDKGGWYQLHFMLFGSWYLSLVIDEASRRWRWRTKV
jgi:hypothetical protein